MSTWSTDSYSTSQCYVLHISHADLAVLAKHAGQGESGVIVEALRPMNVWRTARCWSSPLKVTLSWKRARTPRETGFPLQIAYPIGNLSTLLGVPCLGWACTGQRWHPVRSSRQKCGWGSSHRHHWSLGISLQPILWHQTQGSPARPWSAQYTICRMRMCDMCRFTCIRQVHLSKPFTTYKWGILKEWLILVM